MIKMETDFVHYGCGHDIKIPILDEAGDVWGWRCQCNLFQERNVNCSSPKGESFLDRY